MIFYVIQVFRLFRKEKAIFNDDYSIVKFNTFFFLMYTMCTYLLPFMCLLGVGDEVSLISGVPFQSRYVPFSLFLSSIAVSCYSCGYLSLIKKNRNRVVHSSFIPIPQFSKVNRVFNVLAILLLLYFTYNFLFVRTSDEKDVSGRVGTLVNCFLILPVAIYGYMNKLYKYNILQFIRKYKTIFICILYIVFCMVSIGDRLMTICLISSVTFVISETVFRFTKLQIITAAIVGFLAMTTISMTRGHSFSEGVENMGNLKSEYEMFQDVLPANACLPLGVELQETRSLYKPLRLFPILLSPIPFIPGLVVNTLYDGDISTGNYLTRISHSTTGTQGDSGVGTHVVTDIYLSWGVIGVIFFFSLFGGLVGFFSMRKDNIYYWVAIVGITAWAFFIPRESLFDPYRDTAWMIVIIFYILNIKR